MKLFIKIENNKPINYPLVESNLRLLHPYLNLESKTDLANYGYAIFEKTPEPTSTYKKIAVNEYVWEGDIIKENWTIIELSEEEKTAKQNEQHTSWLATSANCKFPSWTFNVEKCRYEPPLPKPLDEKIYAWNENTVEWVALDLTKSPFLSAMSSTEIKKISIIIPHLSANK